MVSGEEVRSRMQTHAREQERKKRLLALRKDSLRRAAFLRAKLVIDPHDVYGLVKGFFKGFIGRTTEFTIPELREELRHVYLSHKVREDVHALFAALHHLEYTNVTFTREQLVAMLDLFRLVVQESVRAQVRSKGILTRLRDLLGKGEIEPELVIAELPAIERPDPERIALSMLAERCYAALDKRDLRRARAAYRALSDLYHRLPAAHQRTLYPLVDQTYRDLRNRTGSAAIEE